MRFSQHEIDGPLTGTKPCPICARRVTLNRFGSRHLFEIECEYCGRYLLTSDALDRLWHAEAHEFSLLPLLAAHTRQASERQDPATITTEWQELARSRAHTLVPEKLDRALAFIAERSDHPGFLVPMTPDVFLCLPPLFDAKSASEVGFLFDHLTSRGHIKELSVANEKRYVVTVAGWEHLDRHARNPVGTPGRCFVAMSFASEMLEPYEQGIVPAVQIDCGMEPVRVDRLVHNEKICDRILSEIRGAQFVIADFTDQRSGVYFEAGFGLALGKPVVWTCRETQKDTIHRNFDTRQYPHIFWTNPPDLREKLRDRLRAMTQLPARS